MCGGVAQAKDVITNNGVYVQATTNQTAVTTGGAPAGGASIQSGGVVRARGSEMLVIRSEYQAFAAVRQEEAPGAVTMPSVQRASSS